MPTPSQRLNASLLQRDLKPARTPGYDRTQLQNRIVHIGAGAFNRSHLAVYLDDLLELRQHGCWGELGVGLLAPDRALHNALLEQDCLYGVWQRDDEGEQYRVVGSLTGHVYAPQQTEEVIARMASSQCAIISMTVTEGGYFEDPASGEFLAAHPDVVHDLEHPDQPRTWLGYVLQAALRREKHSLGAFTLLSCDNLPHNGDTAKNSLLAFAELRESGMADWLRDNVTFPNSMVDRITPRATIEHTSAIRERYGIEDLAPVVCEPFRQWVLEDKFASGRPAFDAAGAQFTSQVSAYEEVKLRLLNGAHFTLAYSSALLGIPSVADAMRDEQIARLVQQYQREAARTLHDLPGMNVESYSATVRERFSNTTIQDQIARICSEGSAKLRRFLAPPIDVLLRDRLPAETSAYVVASWLRYLDGTDDARRPIAIEDKLLRLPAAHDAAWLRSATLLGPVALADTEFHSRVDQWLALLRREGVRNALKQLLEKAEGWH